MSLNIGAAIKEREAIGALNVIIWEGELNEGTGQSSAVECPAILAFTAWLITRHSIHSR